MSALGNGWRPYEQQTLLNTAAWTRTTVAREDTSDYDGSGDDVADEVTVSSPELTTTVTSTTTLAAPIAVVNTSASTSSAKANKMRISFGLRTTHYRRKRRRSTTPSTPSRKSELPETLDVTPGPITDQSSGHVIPWLQAKFTRFLSERGVATTLLDHERASTIGLNWTATIKRKWYDRIKFPTRRPTSLRKRRRRPSSRTVRGSKSKKSHAIIDKLGSYSYLRAPGYQINKIKAIIVNWQLANA